jgi:hypothetical protein
MLALGSSSGFSISLRPQKPIIASASSFAEHFGQENSKSVFPDESSSHYSTSSRVTSVQLPCTFGPHSYIITV